MIYESDLVAIAEVNGDKYLVQGDPKDELVMFRHIDNLLECEKDEAQRMLGEAYE